MISNFRSVRQEHLAMLLRGLVWQLFNGQFGALVLKGRGARIRVDRRVRLIGLIKVGHYAQLDLRSTAAGSVGPNFSLGDFSILRASGSANFTCSRVHIEKNVSFGPYCNIGGGFGIVIGANVIAGPYVSIHPEEHGMDPSLPIREQDVRGDGIRIDQDCWLGAKSTILDGCHLGKGTVLGAGAVIVGRATEPMSIYVGVPAKFVNFRATGNRSM